MKILKDVRLYFVIVTLALLTLTIHYLNTKEDLIKFQTENVQLQNTLDSLELENFNLSHEIGINELIIDELSHTKKYEDIKKDIENELNSNKYE